MNKETKEQDYNKAMELDWLTVYEYIPSRDLLKSYRVDPEGYCGRGALEEQYLFDASVFVRNTDTADLLSGFEQQAQHFTMRLLDGLDEFINRLEDGMNGENNCITLEHGDAEGFAAFVKKVMAE